MRNVQRIREAAELKDEVMSTEVGEVTPREGAFRRKECHICIEEKER